MQSTEFLSPQHYHHHHYHQQQQHQLTIAAAALHRTLANLISSMQVIEISTASKLERVRHSCGKYSLPGADPCATITITITISQRLEQLSIIKHHPSFISDQPVSYPSSATNHLVIHHQAPHTHNQQPVILVIHNQAPFTHHQQSVIIVFYNRAPYFHYQQSVILLIDQQKPCMYRSSGISYLASATN